MLRDNRRGNLNRGILPNINERRVQAEWTLGEADTWLMSQNDLRINANLITRQISKSAAKKMCYAFAGVSCLNYFGVNVWGGASYMGITIEQFARDSIFGIGIGGIPFKALSAKLKDSLSLPGYSEKIERKTRLLKRFGTTGLGVALAKHRSGSASHAFIIQYCKILRKWVVFNVYYGQKWIYNRVDLDFLYRLPDSEGQSQYEMNQFVVYQAKESLPNLNSRNRRSFNYRSRY